VPIIDLPKRGSAAASDVRGSDHANAAARRQSSKPIMAVTQKMRIHNPAEFDLLQK
jgi:hypothetical protein